MWKLSITLLFLIVSVTQSKAQQRLLDQPVQLKTCNISIEANPFIATTVIEMEFYNSRDREVEASQSFELNRGQVITDFQLELNGKYREGSIEERWKARNAYNTIVGKRIDPALLQMDWQGRYSLNIYPVPAHSSRKIKFTITQLMEEQNSKLVYTLPLRFTGNTNNLSVKIKIDNPATIPYGNEGFLENRLFDMGADSAKLSWHAKDIVLNQPISFSINQFSNQPQTCVSKKNGQSRFLMRIYSNVPVHYAYKPKSINVYWDVSRSGKDRNLEKEINFLEKYIEGNEIRKTKIILFNQQVQGIISYDRNKDNFRSIRSTLLSYKYSGSTDLRNLNFSNVLCDAILLFSDGINSVGVVKPQPGTVQVNCVVSTYQRDDNTLRTIAGNSGGSVIYLLNDALKDAVKKIDSAENYLFRYNATNIRINEQFPIKIGKTILLSGTIEKAATLELVYGNNSSVHSGNEYFLSVDENCNEDLYEKIRMLKAYDSLMYGTGSNRSWQDMLIFGLTQKVVTPQTAYLVLERIEDYIKYKIAPPKELEEKCAEMNYVYRSEYKIAGLKKITEQEALQSVVVNYNKRISWWDKNEMLIDLDRPAAITENNADAPPAQETQNSNTVSLDKPSITGSGTVMNIVMQSSTTSNLKEVVVSGGYGIRRSLKTSSSNTQVVSADQLNTIRNNNINEALAGKVAGIQVR